MTENQEKRYLGKKGIFAYFMSSIGDRFVSVLITSYALIFMTDYRGMNAGIIATLIAVTKLIDGFTDVIAGAIIDHTRSKMGQARAWMFRMILPLAVLQVLFFTIPENWGDIAVYVYFFATYLLFNAIFYTLHYVAFTTMPVYITRNKQEKIYLSIANYGGNTIGGLLIASIYIYLVDIFGGSTRGWQVTAIIFSIIYIVLQLYTLHNLKELKKINFADEDVQKKSNGLAVIVKNIKYLVTNPYFILQFLVMFFVKLYTALNSAIIPYYALHVLDSSAMQGILSLAAMGVLFGLFLAPTLIKKFGIFKSNLYTRIICCIAYAGVLVGGFTQNIAILVVAQIVVWLCSGPYLGSINALVSEISGYTLRKNKVSIDASIFSCNSMGNKLGNAFGVAIVGWLLELVHYDGTLKVQTAASRDMITFCFIWIPFFLNIVITVLIAFLNVEKANRKWDEQHPEETALIAEKIAQLNREE